MSQEAEILDILTGEQRLAKSYRDLGKQIADLEADRKNIKDTEILPQLKEGVSFHLDGEILVLEYVNLVDFDWQRAYKDGAISEETLKTYMSVKVSERLFFRKADDAGRQLYEQYLSRMKEIYDQYKADKKAANEKKQHEIIR